MLTEAWLTRDEFGKLVQRVALAIKCYSDWTGACNLN